MAHNLNSRNGKVSMAYAGETPWHKLGTKVDHLMTAAEVLKKAGLDFTVEKRALFADAGGNDVIEIDGYFATVRTDSDEPLGVVGKVYQPIQNVDGLSVGDPLVAENEMMWETAGALGMGERVWALAKLPNVIKVKGKDIVDKYLLFVNSHDGSSVALVMLTPIRVVCENTLNAALRGVDQSVRIRHTTNAKDKIAEAHKILGLTNKVYEELAKVFKVMASAKMDGKGLVRYVNKLFPDPADKDEDKSAVIAVRDEIYSLHQSGKGSEMARGTVWGAYNAVVEYVDHGRNTKGGEDGRMKSILFGSGARVKRDAFAAAIELAKN